MVPPDPQSIQLGPLALDRIRYQVYLGTVEVRLTRTEFSLLWALASHSGKVFSREELLHTIWGPDVSVESRTIDAHIASIRRKFRRAGRTEPVIDTLWGVGYRLTIPSDRT